MPEEKNNLINPKILIESDFFREAGLEKLPQEEKEKLLQKMLESIKNRVLIRIDDSLVSGGKNDFHKILDEGSDQEIRQFLKGQKIDLKQLVLEESLLQKAEILKNLSELKK